MACIKPEKITDYSCCLLLVVLIIGALFAYGLLISYYPIVVAGFFALIVSGFFAFTILTRNRTKIENGNGTRTKTGIENEIGNRTLTGKVQRTRFENAIPTISRPSFDNNFSLTSLPSYDQVLVNQQNYEIEEETPPPTYDEIVLKMNV